MVNAHAESIVSSSGDWLTAYHLLLEVLKDYTYWRNIERSHDAGFPIVRQERLCNFIDLLLTEEIPFGQSYRRCSVYSKWSSMCRYQSSVYHLFDVHNIHSSYWSERDGYCSSLAPSPSSGCSCYQLVECALVYWLVNADEIGSGRSQSQSLIGCLDSDDAPIAKLDEWRKSAKSFASYKLAAGVELCFGYHVVQLLLYGPALLVRVGNEPCFYGWGVCSVIWMSAQTMIEQKSTCGKSLAYLVSSNESFDGGFICQIALLGRSGTEVA